MLRTWPVLFFAKQNHTVVDLTKLLFHLFSGYEYDYDYYRDDFYSRYVSALTLPRRFLPPRCESFLLPFSITSLKMSFVKYGRLHPRLSSFISIRQINVTFTGGFYFSSCPSLLALLMMLLSFRRELNVR